MKRILLSVLTVVLPVGAIHAQSKNTPTLAETLQWMQNSLDAGGGLLFYSLKDASIEKRSLTLPSAAACEVRFEYQTGVPRVGGGFQKVTYLATYTLNLKDIDPTTIAVFPTGSDVGGPVSTVMATTRNDANLIALRLPLGVPKQDIISTPSNALIFTLATPYAARFTKAFTLAVKMCGGKPSFFADSDGRDGDQRAPQATAVVSAQAAPLRKDIPAIAKAANGAIVSIVMSDKDGKPIAQGSGFLVSKDGVIVTNYHVISEGSAAVVKFPDGAFHVVDGVLASDKARDIAVIKARGQNFRMLPLGNSDRVQVGEDIVAIGNPLSLESTVSNGIVSGIRAVEKEGGKYLQITAPISPGSSGGPLFNTAGEVIGITTMYLKGGENLNFAIPINDAKDLVLLSLSTDSKVHDFPNETEPVQAQTPDATKALTWISSHMSTMTAPRTMLGAGVNGSIAQVRDSYSLSFQGCQVTVYEVGITFTVFKSGETWASGNTTITWGPFDLSNLRPDKIDQTRDKFYQPPGTFLQIDAIQPIPVVQNNGPALGIPGSTVNVMRSALRIWFDSADSVDRQVKAWHDAIVGCGGKPIPDVY